MRRMGKNLFSMEIYGKDGRLDIFGFGGSYGLKKLTNNNTLPERSLSKIISWECPLSDESWTEDMVDFYEDIRLNRAPSAGVNGTY